MKRGINHSGRARFLHSALLVLLAWLLTGLPAAHAAPAPQDDPAAQCAEGVRLFEAGRNAEALPLLEAGFAGREQAIFAGPDDIGDCALFLGGLRLISGNTSGALEAFTSAQEAYRQGGNQKREGFSLVFIGAVYASQGEYYHALNYFHQAQALAAKTNDDEIGNMAFVGIGAVYRDQGQYNKALDNYQQSLATARAAHDLITEGGVLNNIGTVYRAQGLYEQARKSFEQGLVIAREVGDRFGESSALNNLGGVFLDQAHYVQALEVYQQSLTIRQQMGDRSGEADTLNGIGLVHHLQGQYSKALDFYQQALAINREIGDRSGEGTVLNNLGGVYHDQGQNVTALPFYQQALTIARAVGDRTGEATRLNNLGALYNDQGYYDKALDYFQQALSISRATGYFQGQISSLNNLGRLYEVQGQYARVAEYCQQALVLAQEVGNRRSEGIALNNLALAHQGLNEYDDSLDKFQQALTIAREISDRPHESVTLSNIGEVFRAKGQYVEALGTYQQALAIARELGLSRSEGITLNNIALIYQDQGRYEEAARSLQSALDLQRRLRMRDAEGMILFNLGSVYANQGHPDQALATVQQAMDVLEEVRATAGNEQARAGFIGQYADLYTRAAALAHQQGQDELAFQISERGRARAFLDSLATGYVQLSDQEAQALLTHEQESYAARQAVRDALAKARAADPPDAALVAELEQQLATAERAHDEALRAIEQRGDELAALVPSRTKGVLAVKDVQALLDPDTTLISFFVSDDQTLAFIVTSGNFSTIALPIAKSDLDGQVGALRLFANTSEPYPPAAVRLYQELIAPLKARLTTPHLAIVPHSALHYLPFAALTDGQRFLVDDYALSVLPSASSLVFIQQNAVGRAPGAPLIMGNPATDVAGLKSLTHAEDEARAVAELYNVEPLLGAAATEGALVQQAGQAGIVHLAAHGRFERAAPLASAVYLAPDTLGAAGQPGQDGRLEAGEIYGLDLHHADLVVLSACQTQQGDLSAGDELVGLTRAFFFAGTPSVIATLWEVDDEASGLLMERFYTHLRAGMGKAEALRQAQVELRAQYPNFYYWGAFVLSGDAGATPSTLADRLLPLWPWLAGGGLLIMGAAGAGVMLWRRTKRTRQSPAKDGGGIAPVEPDALLAALLAQPALPESANRGRHE